MVESVILCISVFVIIVNIAVQWANGIKKMMDEHPNYKGEDFLN